jgi:hypothetical protein
MFLKKRQQLMAGASARMGASPLALLYRTRRIHDLWQGERSHLAGVAPTHYYLGMPFLQQVLDFDSARRTFADFDIGHHQKLLADQEPFKFVLTLYVPDDICGFVSQFFLVLAFFHSEPLIITPDLAPADGIDAVDIMFADMPVGGQRRFNDRRVENPRVRVRTQSIVRFREIDGDVRFPGHARDDKERRQQAAKTYHG